MKPFTTGSKSARGGVAIYVKDDLKAFERDDLNIIENEFEAIWIEIDIEKSKNIICGCFYRHPNSAKLSKEKRMLSIWRF